MLSDELSRRLVSELPFEPTSEQYGALARIALFLLNPSAQSAFVLCGYAGTGKTSLVAALVRALHKAEMPVCLLAPTGRAAKVFASKAGFPAYTIHKVIYRQRAFKGEDTTFDLGFNHKRGTLFVVDEASMISNDAVGQSPFGTGRLLDDLIHFAYEAEGCRLLFVGDTAQLPPVGQNESPALSVKVLGSYGLQVERAALTQVVRQAEGSGILWNATRLRRLLDDDTVGNTLPRLRAEGFADVRLLSGDEMQEELEQCYNRTGIDETIVITRSNKRAVGYNMGIRAITFGREEELTTGDLLMVVKNNYFWMEQVAAGLSRDEAAALPLDFIANGDLARVVRIRRRRSLYGFDFANVTLQLPDYDDFELEAVILLNALRSEAPALTRQESEKLFQGVLADYDDIPSKRDKLKKVRTNPEYNALQVKFAYAVTCHKAQGGQWRNVFLDQGYLPEESRHDPAYLRWLYTALTRATETVYLVNWPPAQTEGEALGDF